MCNIRLCVDCARPKQREGKKNIQLFQLRKAIYSCFDFHSGEPHCVTINWSARIEEPRTKTAQFRRGNRVYAPVSFTHANGANPSHMYQILGELVGRPCSFMRAVIGLPSTSATTAPHSSSSTTSSASLSPCSPTAAACWGALVCGQA